MVIGDKWILSVGKEIESRPPHIWSPLLITKSKSAARTMTTFGPRTTTIYKKCECAQWMSIGEPTKRFAATKGACLKLQLQQTKQDVFGPSVWRNRCSTMCYEYIYNWFRYLQAQTKAGETTSTYGNDRERVRAPEMVFLCAEWLHKKIDYKTHSIGCFQFRLINRRFRAWCANSVMVFIWIRLD